MNASKIPYALDSASYAEQVLNTYKSPIALERPENLLFMHVGSGRIAQMQGILTRMRKFLTIEERLPTGGAHLELLIGEYGSGKSHLGYLIKHDCLTGMRNVLLSQVQITNEASWAAALSAILRNFRISGVSSLLLSEVEISAFRTLFHWCGGSTEELQRITMSCLGQLPRAVGTDFALAVEQLCTDHPDIMPLLRFLDVWINTADNKRALLVFEMVLRIFFQLKQRRFVLILDEFEAVESQPTQRQIELLQSLQDLFDDLSGRMPGLPASFLLLLTTPGWQERCTNLLPSLFGRGQRLRGTTQLEPFNPADVAALVYRYVSLVQLSRWDAKSLGVAEIQAVIDETLQENASVLHQLRTLHGVIRSKVEDRCLRRSGALEL